MGVVVRSARVNRTRRSNLGSVQYLKLYLQNVILTRRGALVYPDFVL